MEEMNFYYGLMIASAVIAVVMFILLFFISAPYGRHVRRGWGPSISSKVGWIIMEAPAVIIFGVILAFSERRFDLIPLAFAFLWLSHYIQRDLIFPFFLRTNKRMPILIMFFGMLFQTSNTYLNARWIFVLAPEGYYHENWFLDPRFIIGVIFFITGYIINRHSDITLRDLRKPGEKGYKIPFGGFYRFVSSPNYLGEIILWTGWALSTWCLPGLLFIIWTLANLIPRAKSHHEWYKETFEEYPEKRKIIFPFIY